MIKKSDVKNLLVDKIKADKITKIRLQGSSMLPTISSDTELDITPHFVPKVGDIVVASDPDLPICVVHRVVEIDEEGGAVALCGDNQHISAKKWFASRQIIAKVTGVEPNFHRDCVNLVLDLPLGKSKTFNPRSLDVYFGLKKANQNSYFFDLNIEYNNLIFGENIRQKFKTIEPTPAEFRSLEQHMTLIRQSVKARYGLFKFNYDSLQRCDYASAAEVEQAIKEYQKSPFFDFFSSKIDELRVNFGTKIAADEVKIYLPVDGFERLMSALEFSQILTEKLGKKPILVDNSTLFGGKYDTSKFQPYFEKIINGVVFDQEIDDHSEDYSVIDFDRYLSRFPLGCVRVMRECYYKRCKFCDRHGRDNFCFPVESILARLQNLVSRGVEQIVFEDDCLVPEYMLRLLTSAKAKGLKFRWQGTFRFESRLNNEDIIRAFSESGCRLLFFGLESFSQTHLDRIDKGIKVADAIEILRLCQKYHIRTNVSLLFNFDGETTADLQADLEGLRQHIDLIDNCEFNFFVPTKNCKLPPEDADVNYFLPSRSLTPTQQSLIGEILTFANTHNKINSFYLKNYLAWTE